jgi:hypothetical protein
MLGIMFPNEILLPVTEVIEQGTLSRRADYAVYNRNPLV